MFGSASTVARENAEVRSERNRSSLLGRAVRLPMTAVSALSGAALKMTKDRLGYTMTTSASPRLTIPMARTSFTTDHQKPPSCAEYDPAPIAPTATNLPRVGGQGQESNDIQRNDLSPQEACQINTGYKHIPPRRYTNDATLPTGTQTYRSRLSIPRYARIAQRDPLLKGWITRQAYTYGTPPRKQ